MTDNIKPLVNYYIICKQIYAVKYVYLLFKNYEWTIDNF